MTTMMMMIMAIDQENGGTEQWFSLQHELCALEGPRKRP